MGTTKTEHYEERHIKMAALAKAIAHPARIAILEVLLKSGTCVCGDIVLEMGLAQSTISQHLKAMKEGGLIKGEVEGQRSCYCVNNEALTELKGVVDTMIEDYKRGPCC